MALARTDPTARDWGRMEVFEGIQWGAVAGALALGLRHGFDWDHLAAITDITSSQSDSRRALSLSTLYILGHGLVITVLGLIAVSVGSTIPAWLDGAMGKVIGATLVALGVYVIASLIRHGPDARMRSRWMLAIGGARRALRWLGARRAGDATTPVVIDHEHDHPSDEPHDLEPVRAGVVAARTRTRSRSHRHRHLHLGALPDDPFMEYGRTTSFLVGMLHGVGAETPTQMLLFATAAGAATAWVGAVFVLAFVTGLVGSNTVVAVVSRRGVLSVARNFAVYATVSVVVAALSLGLGTSYLLS